jgi:ketosteroid isomerase-like protein
MYFSKVFAATLILIASSFSNMALSQPDNVEQINRLIADYGWYADNRDIQEYSGLFIDDAVFESPKMGLSLRGRQQIVDFMTARWKKQEESGEQRRHIITGIAVTDVENETARYRAILTLTVKPKDGMPKIVLAGYYEAEVVKQGEDWRFARLIIHADM